MQAERLTGAQTESIAVLSLTAGGEEAGESGSGSMCSLMMASREHIADSSYFNSLKSTAAMCISTSTPAIDLLPAEAPTNSSWARSVEAALRR